MHFGNLPNIQQNGIIHFSIPIFEDLVYKAQATVVEAANPDEYKWIGKLVDNAVGDIAVMKDPQGGTCALINLIDRTYSVFPIKGNIGVLAKVNHQIGETVCSAGSEGVSSSTEFCDATPDCSEGELDVLVLITDEAREFFADINNPFIATLFANFAFATVEIALINSGISNKKIRCRPIAFDFNDYSINLDIRDDCETLEELPEAQNLRNLYGADLVVMLTNQNYPNARGFASTVEPNDEESYAVVEVDAMIGVGPDWVLAHEMGHLLGADHNFDDNGRDIMLHNDCAHGWKFTDNTNTEQRTVLALNFNNTGRILHYSNPAADFNGQPTGNDEEGDISDSNNARKIDNAYCEVMHYRPSPEFSAIIGGSPLFCGIGQSSSQQTYYASVTPSAPDFPVKPPYQYEWRWTTDGFSFPDAPGTFLGNQPTVTIGQLLNCPSFFLHLKVTGSDGEVYNTSRSISTAFCTDCPGLAENPIERSNSNKSNTDISALKDIAIYPVPARSNIFVQFSDRNTLVNSRFTILNLQGKAIFDKQIDAEEKKLNINTSGFSSGVYICKWQNAETVISKKIVVSQ